MLPRRRFHPNDHLSIGIPLNHSHGLACGEMIFIGGQADIDCDAKVTRPNDLVAQTKIAMEAVLKILAGMDAAPGDLVKINTYYVGEEGESDLRKNAAIRTGYYRDPGPASTAIPFSYLAYEDMVIEIDCVAML